MANEIIFSGSVPQRYEDYLTGFLFDGFAADIAKRVAISEGMKVLELAAGTGAVTRQLVKHLPGSAKLTATDLQAGMLDVARQSITATNIHWATVDMTVIPYDDDEFDAIVCQFGLMLVPAKEKALQEMRRVLKPGGQLLFNVWGDLHANDIWKIGGEVVASFIGDNPITQDPGPFSMDQRNTLPLLKTIGVTNVIPSVVDQQGSIETAKLAAQGFIEGLPVIFAIKKSNPALLPKIELALEQELITRLGDTPLLSSLQALVFEAYK